MKLPGQDMNDLIQSSSVLFSFQDKRQPVKVKPMEMMQVVFKLQSPHSSQVLANNLCFLLTTKKPQF